MSYSQAKYILTERIAQGGMAEIHLGKTVGIDGFARVCAFKRILTHYAQVPEFVEMFRNEANVAKQLQNKNIVQVYDFVSDGSSYMLVMEFVDGQDLRGVLSATEQVKKRVPIELACYIAMETLSGLSYAHSAVDVTGKSMGIIHRDVSPQNILISYDGDVKITDFGIAKAENQISNTRVGVLKGKFRYMSPEQASGYNIDARSDLFAVGIILHEMLTMSRLFKGEDLAVLEAVRNCQIKPPSAVAGNSIPEELDKIVMKLLAKDPLSRYQNGRDAVRDLSRFLYKYRPDFFIGELSDFMHAVFAERLEAARERLRSTLALPIGSPDPQVKAGNVFGDRINSTGSAQVIDLNTSMTDLKKQSRPGGEQNERQGQAVALGQSQLRGQDLDAGNAFALDLKRRPEGTGMNRPGLSQHARGRGAGPQGSLVVPPSVYFDSAQERKRQKRKSLLMPAFALVLALVAFVFGLYVVKNRGVGLPSTLTITTSPQNVRMTVDLDGRPMWKGKPVAFPIQLSVPPGQHRITLSRPGLKTKQLDVKASPLGGQLQEQVILERDPNVPTAQLRIITEPSAAKVTTFDGWDGGESPYLFRLIPIGQKIRFRIQHPRCKSGVFEETLSAEDINRISVRRLELRECKP
jgi:serine/threonine protein kinase